MKPEEVNGEKLLERAKQLAREGGLGDALTIELGTNTADPTDQHILVEYIFGVYWNEDTIVQPESFEGVKFSDAQQKFGAFSIDYDPGVMYHADGFGTPPSADVVDIGELHSTFESAFIEVIKLAVAKRIDDFLTFEDENKLADEMEALDEMMAANEPH